MSTDRRAYVCAEPPPMTLCEEFTREGAYLVKNDWQA